MSETRVPEKPALEGLEAKWQPRWEAEAVYRFDRTAAARRGLRHRHAAAHRERLAARRATSSPTRTPTSSRATSGCAAWPSSTRWAGTTTACRPSAACRTTTACAAIRRCRTTRPSSRPRAPGKQPISVSRPNFIELCERLTEQDEKAFERLWQHLGLSVDWSMTYATIGTRLAERLAAGVPRPARARASAYQLEAPTLWDVDFRTAVAQAELEDRERRARTTRSASRAPTARAPIEIDTTRPELMPACVALVAHPDDERYQPLFGTEVRDAALRRAGADPRASAGRSREGHRHRDDLHVRRPDRRHLVARAEPAGARDPPGRTARCARSRSAATGWESRDAARGAGRLRPAGRPTSVARRARRSSSCCRESGDLLGEPRPITHAVKFYEKGDRPLEIVTSRQWFIRTMPHRER